MYVTRVALKKTPFSENFQISSTPPHLLAYFGTFYFGNSYNMLAPPCNVVWKFLMSEFVENLEEGQLFK